MYRVPNWRRALPCRMRNLNGPERATLTNGCGGKGGWLNPPDFMYTASCNHHDFNYWLGGTEADRLEADRKFYEAMKRDVARLPWYRRPFYYGIAWMYYRAVRLCGKRFFHYRVAARESHQRQWSRVELEMSRAGWQDDEGEFD